MTASKKRTVRVVALWILALCLVIPLGACAYQQGSSAIQALASTASDTNAEAAETSRCRSGRQRRPRGRYI